MAGQKMWERLSKIYDLLGGSVGAVSVIGASIAVIGALAGTITSYLVAGRTVYINSITAERSKWIDKLRNNIANYSNCLAQLVFRIDLLDGPKGADYLGILLKEIEELYSCRSAIQLQLNPWGEIDKNILKLITGLKICSENEGEKIYILDKLLISHAQWLLKSEWEKVKFEARGPIYRWWHKKDAEWRLEDYRLWCSKDGNIEPVLEHFAAMEW